MEMKKSEIIRMRIMQGKPEGYKIHPLIERLLKKMEEEENKIANKKEE